LNRLKTLLVGFGKIAVDLATDPIHAKAYPYATHAQVLKEHPAFDWLAVVDSDERACQKAKDDWQVEHVSTDVRFLTIAEDIEVAVIATPPESRSVILESLPNLKLVLIEKPIASILEEAKKFISLCEKKGISLAVCLPRRYDKSLRHLADADLKNKIGNPLTVSAFYGNGLQNNGTHLIDLIRMQLGEIKTVRALSESPFQSDCPIKNDFDINFTCLMKSGLEVMVSTIDFHSYREIGMDIWGEKGRLQLMHESLTSVFSPMISSHLLTGAFEISQDKNEISKTSCGTALFDVYDNLAASIQELQPLYCSGESAFQTMKIVEAIRLSAKQSCVEISPDSL